MIKGPLVLVVDDTEQNLEVIISILSENNYDIAVAINGREALEFIDQKIPDIVLLDIMMPEIDGFEVCTKLKSNDRTKEIPIIFLTAKTETEDIIKGFILGGIDYITKPYRKEELLIRVKTHLDLAISKNKLKESEQKLRNIIEHSGEGILLSNELGELLEWNTELEKISGYSRNEIIGKYIWDIFFKLFNKNATDDSFYQDLKAKQIQILQNGLNDDFPNVRELKIYTKDHTEKLLELQGFAFKTENGFFAGAVLRDITLRKRLNDEIEKVQKLDSIGILAGGIAHNFNNLMAGILGNIDLARQYSSNNFQILKFLDAAFQALPKAKDLTNQLITFAKGGEPIKKKYNVSIIIKELIDSIILTSNYDYFLKENEELWDVLIDQIQIKQAISNILLNAIQSMPDYGKVEIYLDNIDEDELFDKALPLSKGKYVRITIKDQGIGIPEENKKKIFDPFFSTYVPTRTGLGLSVAFSIIKRHNGHITFDSIINQGSTFYIYLPTGEK